MKFNPKQIERAMKKMGMQSKEIPAEKVVITTADKEIVITNPQVQRVNMMGQDSFQISGDVSEQSLEKFSADDVQMVMDQTGAGEEDVRASLEETGDLAETILKLKK